MAEHVLLTHINAMIKSALHKAVDKGLIDDMEFIKRIKQDNNLPYRKLQALILTSPAFLGMSSADAANVMGVDTAAVDTYLYRLRTEYPKLVNFESVWRTPEVLSFNDRDEENVTRVF